MTYYLAWLLLMMVGLTASVLLFLWALQSGQFSDQTRARYLPLVGETHNTEGERKAGKERYAMVVILAGAGCAFFVTLIMAIVKSSG